MDHVTHLVVGAGITGLAFAAAVRGEDVLVLEKDDAIGGYCKTVSRDGFVWDYSGHFFHFKHPEIEAWLRERMPGQRVRTVNKRSFIAYGDRQIDFPFQKNIHQLPLAEFIECLHDLYFARDASGSEENFEAMLHARFGRSIADKFLIPYNEKLYACPLSSLDKNAMGRFFPYADVADVLRHMKAPADTSYNASFSYPEGGAVQYVNAIASEVRPERIALGEALESLDLERRVARTNRREIRYENLVTSAPFNRLVAMAGLPHDPSVFSWNKVLVHNLGFDRKGRRDAHWVYYPNRARSFYRVGYYDNIFDADRMSLYVEVGYAKDAPVDIEASQKRVLEDLRAEGVITDHELVASHAVVMDPAYVHITEASLAEHARMTAILREHRVHAVGRYGGWTYCSIEDDIVEARALAKHIGAS